MAIPWEGIGLLLAAFAGGLGKSCYNGLLRRAVINPLLDKQRSAKHAHDAIPEVRQTVGRIEDKVDDLTYTVAYLHREELSEEPLVRDRLDIENDHDILDD